jgi:hypothetical protein
MSKYRVTIRAYTELGEMSMRFVVDDEQKPAEARKYYAENPPAPGAKLYTRKIRESQPGAAGEQKCPSCGVTLTGYMLGLGLKQCPSCTQGL